jgi:hypothetical protein
METRDFTDDVLYFMLENGDITEVFNTCNDQSISFAKKTGSEITESKISGYFYKNGSNIYASSIINNVFSNNLNKIMKNKTLKIEYFVTEKNKLPKNIYEAKQNYKEVEHKIDGIIYDSVYA